VSTAQISSNLILFNPFHLQSNPIEAFLQRVASRSASQNKHLLLYRERRSNLQIQPRVDRSNLIFFNSVHLHSNRIELFLKHVASRSESASQNKHLLLYRERRIVYRSSDPTTCQPLKSHPISSFSTPFISNPIQLNSFYSVMPRVLLLRTSIYCFIESVG
jgi:hypothetical protein